MSQRAVVLGVAALLLASAGGLWFFNHFERVEEEVEVGYQGEARINPFLAAERLFTRLGAPARTLAAGPRTVPPPGHTLVLFSPERSLSAERFAEILGWVQQGGRLLVAPGDAPSLDPILRHWSVTVVEDPDVIEHETLQIPLRDGVKATAELSRHRRLAVTRKDAAAQIGSDLGLFIVRYPEGQGSVTFVADPNFLDNENIGQHDHAAIGWALIRGGGDVPAGVWIAVRDQIPTLGQLLVRNAWMALLSGALLIAAWLWSSGARFGPLLPEPPRDRRSLLEHVEASGDFLWRTGRGEDLVQSARQALLQRIDLREPGWGKLDPAELVRRLAAGARLPAAQVDRALHGPAKTPAEFLHALQTLETVRRSL